MSVDPTNWPYAQTFFDGYSEGRGDDAAHLAFLYDSAQIRVSEDGKKLYIGRAGTDGIEFVYRRDMPGIWAYYPIDDDYQPLADTIDEFVSGWTSGQIKV